MLSQQQIPEFNFMKNKISISTEQPVFLLDTKKVVKSQEKGIKSVRLDDTKKISRFDDIFTNNSELVLSVKSINFSASSEDNDIFNEKESTDERISNMSSSSAINKLKRFPSPTNWMIERHKKILIDYLGDNDVSFSNTSFNSELSHIPYSESGSSTRSYM